MMLRKYWPSMTTEALRSGDTGCGTEEYRRGIRDGAQACHQRLHGYKQLTNDQLKKNADLELDKPGFRSNKEIVTNIHKGHHI